MENQLLIRRWKNHHQSGRVYNGTCPEDKTMGDHTVGVTGPTLNVSVDVGDVETVGVR